MKRAMYAVIVLWAVLTAVYMTNMGRADKVSISTAFTDSVDGEEWCELDTYIEGYGKFGVCYLTQEEKERLVENIASALGITSSYGLATVCEDEVNITVLSKESVDGSVTIKAITQEPQVQYVYVNITVYNNIDCAVSYRELVEGMFDAMGIQGNVNMNLVGSIEGTLNSTEKNELADGLFYPQSDSIRRASSLSRTERTCWVMEVRIAPHLRARLDS